MNRLGLMAGLGVCKGVLLAFLLITGLANALNAHAHAVILWDGYYQPGCSIFHGQYLSEQDACNKPLVVSCNPHTIPHCTNCSSND